MTIQAVDARRVRITLSAEDMQALGVSYQELLFGGDRIGPALIRLLAAAKEQVGFRCEAEKLFIEVYPLEEEGCILYFTGLRRPARYRVKESGILPRLFLFRDADTLCSACRAVYRRMSHRVWHSSLYRLDRGQYVLSVYPLDSPRSHVLCLLGEFGEYIGQGRLLESVIREHAALLRENDAVEVLA